MLCMEHYDRWPKATQPPSGDRVSGEPAWCRCTWLTDFCDNRDVTVRNRNRQRKAGNCLAQYDCLCVQTALARRLPPAPVSGDLAISVPRPD